MDRDWFDDDCERDDTNVGVTHGLEELRDALTPEEGETHLLRRHRGVIVLGIVVSAFWLGIAGMVSAATRSAPMAETVLAFEPPPAAAAAAVEIGPNEWPTIGMEPRRFEFKKHNVVPTAAKARATPAKTTHQTKTRTKAKKAH